VALNIFLNWILIYGNLGAPALGLTGAGVATLIARIFNTVLLFAWLRLDRRFEDCWPLRWWAPVPLQGIWNMVKLGVPVGMQLFFEVGAFSFAVFLMGWLGTVELAAHQIAITCAATTFMIPLGISLAVAIRVGHVLGAGQPERARPVGFGGMGFAIFLSVIFTTCFIVFSHPLAGLFSPDPETVSLAASLIVVAGFFQLVDGTQVLGAGALRGCKDVNVPSFIIFISYWVIAIPGGAALAFAGGFGALGVWLGLAGGLGFAAVGLVIRFFIVTRRLLKAA
jgi:MATE family multidrug resistance protein